MGYVGEGVRRAVGCAVGLAFGEAVGCAIGMCALSAPSLTPSRNIFEKAIKGTGKSKSGSK